MSNNSALASARKRRAPPVPPQLQPPSITTNSNPQTLNAPQTQQKTPPLLTLEQVISITDKRLMTLEKFMQETSTTPKGDEVPDNITEVLDEFQNRHEFIINEITSLKTDLDTLKNTIISLQTYTMEVNKMLLEEKLASTTDES